MNNQDKELSTGIICNHNYIQRDANWSACTHCGTVIPLSSVKQSYATPAGKGISVKELVEIMEFPYNQTYRICGGGKELIWNHYKSGKEIYTSELAELFISKSESTPPPTVKEGVKGMSAKQFLLNCIVNYRNEYTTFGTLQAKYVDDIVKAMEAYHSQFTPADTGDKTEIIINQLKDDLKRVKNQRNEYELEVRALYRRIAKLVADKKENEWAKSDRQDGEGKENPKKQ